MKLHSYLSEKCSVRTVNNKTGVFADQDIKKGALVAVWGGIIYLDAEIKEISKKYSHFLTHPVSVCEGFFIGPINFVDLDDVEYINHSCDPNIGVKGQIILLARRDISPNEEICFDYETTEMNAEEFACDCGAKNCRKQITGNAWRDPEFQKNNAGYFSWYIEEKIRTHQY